MTEWREADRFATDTSALAYLMGERVGMSEGRAHETLAAMIDGETAETVAGERMMADTRSAGFIVERQGAQDDREVNLFDSARVRPVVLNVTSNIAYSASAAYQHGTCSLGELLDAVQAEVARVGRDCPVVVYHGHGRGAQWGAIRRPGSVSGVFYDGCE